MKHKLNQVLLIDDDKTTNILNSMVIKQTGCTEKVVAVNNGIEALEYLKSGEEGHHPQPDLIFLDINMPGMDGWEFMEAYKVLEEKYQGDVIVVMLTTSINPDDRKKSLALTGLSDFMNKPLTRQQFTALIEKNFPKLAEEMSAANPG
jgi:CheY-like chemotaxis protein